MDKIKIGIFFGGPSREREISFAGGRTVYDNLNKAIFQPVPIFVDSFKNFIELDWPYIYKGTIRDFYPPVDFLPESPHAFQVYAESLDANSPDLFEAMAHKVGRPIAADQLSSMMDIAFLSLHGEYGEDGQIQALLKSLGIPFTGSGILPCAIGMDKGVQKKLMKAGGFLCPEMISIQRKNLGGINFGELFEDVKEKIGTSFVIRPANQGSSIGVSILHDPTPDEFKQKVYKAFFIQRITGLEWMRLSPDEKADFVRRLTDIRDGLGFPLKTGNRVVLHPEDFLHYLNETLTDPQKEITAEAYHGESAVIIESFIRGKEFSCIVIEDHNGQPIALPPTEIRKEGQLYDYKSKYLPGLSRKVTPIEIEHDQIERIRTECVRLYDFLGFNTYARIDGFITDDYVIYLNDPNTTSGMMPSSFFFHQAAEIGIDPSQFLSYIVSTSVRNRKEESLEAAWSLAVLQDNLQQKLAGLAAGGDKKIKVAVILGGYSFERHISVESGRNIYEKLSSSEKYLPIPIFLKKSEDGHELYRIPINLLLKDNADDIAEKIDHFQINPIIRKIKEETDETAKLYRSHTHIDQPEKIGYADLAQLVDAAFIALHGRPGEDGTVQLMLKEHGIPYNGSHTESSRLTIHKYDTLQTLKQHGFTVADQMIVDSMEYQNNTNEVLTRIEERFTYPFIAKPVDDGCSSAVMKIRNRKMLEDYLHAIYRTSEELTALEREVLGLAYNEEFPRKQEVLIESLIQKGEAEHFLEITGGLLTHHDGHEVRYEVFEPSEALASGEILSLEEKFLAGEGQNLTPARFGKNYTRVAEAVKRDLERAAVILGVEGYARIDAFVRIFKDNSVETIIIEVNSLPGMTPATCIFHQSAINGYKPYDFIDKILQYALHEQTLVQ